MQQISLASMQACINAAFYIFAQGPRNAGIERVQTQDGVVPVTYSIQSDQSRFNCGTDRTGNYTLSANEADNLRTWCGENPGNNWFYGYRGPDATHPNQVNITLIHWNAFMFNFHVMLS